MFKTLKLLLPALIPSWRFFDVIAPSPRIQFALMSSDNDVAKEWHEFRPRPEHLSLIQMSGRMLWNPSWNESLFLVSCAERLLQKPTQHSEDEILNRIAIGLMGDEVYASLPGATRLQFRLALVQREESAITQEIVFYSSIRALTTRGAAWT